MKYFKSKFVCLFLVFVVILQSCAVYQKNLVSIEEATATNHKVLIIKTDDTKLKLKKIELINGKYYGVVKDDNWKIIKIRLNESEIKTIRVLDKSTSTLLTIGAVVVPIIAIIIIVSTADIYGCGGCGLAE
jgi:hypothetical protein